jgi:hypothetical protein
MGWNLKGSSCLAVFPRSIIVTSECISKDLLLHQPAQYCDGLVSAIKTGLFIIEVYI